MGSTYISLNEAQPGLILHEDVFKNTAQPIIKKDTELTEEHLEVLRVFEIQKVKVKRDSIERKAEQSQIQSKTTQVKTAQATYGERRAWEKQYEEVVIAYKRKFLSWRAGAATDVSKVRALIMPLVKDFKGQEHLLSFLPNLSKVEDYPYHHAVALGIITSAIGREMGFSEGQCLQLALAAVLADCGMAKIDASIVEKTAFLTKEEFNEVKKHPVFSYQMVRKTPLLRNEMKLAILQHHERLDGSGYPRGERMEQISPFSQIIAVADVFHAMTSKRTYRSKESPFKVLEMIKEEEFGKFNIKIVNILHDLICKLSIGSNVRLTNGEEGNVVFIHRDAKLRPIIKMIEDDTILDLSKNRQLFIEKIIY